MRRTGFHSIKMVDWTKQTGDKDLGRGIDASATGKLGEKINWCTIRSVLRPFEVYWMAIAIILRMLREKNRSPSFVHLMPPFLDCAEGCKQGIHFYFWQLL